MSAMKRIRVAEPVLKDLAEMCLVEERKKARLTRDMQRIEEEGTFVPFSGIRS